MSGTNTSFRKLKSIDVDSTLEGFYGVQLIPRETDYGKAAPLLLDGTPARPRNQDDHEECKGID